MFPLIYRLCLFDYGWLGSARFAPPPVPAVAFLRCTISPWAILYSCECYCEPSLWINKCIHTSQNGVSVLCLRIGNWIIHRMDYIFCVLQCFEEWKSFPSSIWFYVCTYTCTWLGRAQLSGCNLEWVLCSDILLFRIMHVCPIYATENVPSSSYFFGH